MQTNRRRDWITLCGGLIVVLLLNYIGSFVFTRYDLTFEKRYSLSESSKKLASELEDIVYVKVYLEGDFPAEFKRLRDETREMLDEFRAYGGTNIAYEFINPSASSDEKEKNDIYKQLAKKGLRPTDLQVKSENGFASQLIWPGAIFSYRGEEIPVQLLKSQIGAGSQKMLNSSIEALEYEISNAIHQLIRPIKPRVAFVVGHGELDEYQSASLGTSLAEFYAVDRIQLNGKLSSLTERVERDSTSTFVVRKKYEAIIIAKPLQRFSEKDKFIIDQYIMYGGKVVWLVEPVLASMDSLQKNNVTMALPMDLNLSDQLFTYGVRLNNDLIQDIQAAPIPVVTGQLGNQPKTEFFPWFYFPLLMPSGNHPIVHNLNAVKASFISTIDTTNVRGIRKTPLLQSSQYSRVSNIPTRISLSMLRMEPNPEQFNQGSQMGAVLLEGTFTSVFKNRITPQLQNSNEIAFKEQSTPTAMIVISDGDVAKNHVNATTKQYLSLGFDKYTQQEYGNKDFMLNLINYLCDNSGLMSVRSKSLKIRLLNNSILKKQRTKWQLINTLLPIGLVLLFGLAHYFDRKKKYARQK